MFCFWTFFTTVKINIEHACEINSFTLFIEIKNRKYKQNLYFNEIKPWTEGKPKVPTWHNLLHIVVPP